MTGGQAAKNVWARICRIKKEVIGLKTPKIRRLILAFNTKNHSSAGSTGRSPRVWVREVNVNP